MKTNHKIIFGDSRNMDDIDDESIHLILTSPPYWQLKDYGSNKQIGFNDSYEQYVNNLNLVWNECYRILHNGCRLCINIGDQFARAVYYGRYKVIPIRTEIIKFCEIIGFDYMGAIIWQKVTTCNTTGGASVMGSYPYPRNGIIKIDYEFILIFKKLGKLPKVSKEIKQKSKMSNDEWNKYFNGHWVFPGEKQVNHLAMFPEELPKRLIRMFSFYGETVLDPFLGSGTTTLAAKNQIRNSVGYEINSEFEEIIKDRIGLHQDSLLIDSEIKVIKKDIEKSNYNDEINSLPYIFNDPVSFDKKINPKELTFGSKIDGTNSERTKYYTIQKILNPNSILLNNNLRVRLLGIKINEDFKQKATFFLSQRFLEKKVFLKYDSIKFDNDNNLLVYVFLKNKTFINAHLIKSGFVDVETNINYKHKNRFLKYRRKNGKGMDSK